MTEKRFTDIEHDYENARIRCKVNGMFMLYAIYENDDGLPTLGSLLNEQEELTKRLKTIREEQTETILKQKRKIKELEERNKRQYDRLKELTDLMQKRDWETLDNIVDNWEKADELLQKEWGTYCENK